MKIRKADRIVTRRTNNSPIGTDSVFSVSAVIKIFVKDYVSSLSWDYNSEF